MERQLGRLFHRENNERALRRDKDWWRAGHWLVQRVFPEHNGRGVARWRKRCAATRGGNNGPPTESALLLCTQNGVITSPNICLLSLPLGAVLPTPPACTTGHYRTGPAAGVPVQLRHATCFSGWPIHETGGAKFYSIDTPPYDVRVKGQVKEMAEDFLGLVTTAPPGEDMLRARCYVSRALVDC